VLIALSGCDSIFSLDHIDLPSAPCGPYRSVQPLPITGVLEPQQFSITADEQLAMVMGLDSQMRRRPFALAWNGEAWEPHGDYQKALDNRGIEGARLAPFEETPTGQGYTGIPEQPAMNAWILNTGRQQVDRYFWTTNGWTLDANQGSLFDGPDFDVHAGNVVVVKNTTNVERVRHTVVTKIAVEQGYTNQVLLYANNLPNYTLTAKERTDPLNEQAAAIDLALGDAVLTENQATLVYAGVSGGQSDIYASAQSPVREFALGGLITSVETGDDEVEPWINATCSKLYFRRIPAGSPNDPGQIYVAQ
jgi:hypothetical protein